MNDREQELVQAVRELARGSFTERADAADKAGTFTTENVEELQALNVPGMMLGEAWEGGAMSPEAAVRVVEEIAYGDASTAVALNMYLLIANAVESFPSFPARDAALFDIAKNQALICGAGSVPTSALDTRTSGYRGREDGDDIVIKGRAGFASMSEGATYTIIGGLLEADPEAEDPTVMLTVPRMDTPGLINHMNWSAMGLRGTASHDLEAQDMRIPKTDVFMVPLSLARMAQQNMPLEAIQRRSWGGLGILGIWLGLAQAAFDFTIAYVEERYGYLAGTGQIGGNVGFRADESWAQMGIGNMEHWLETGRVILYDTVRRLDEPFESTQAFTRHLVRTVYHLRRMAEEVAMGAMKTCGAHAYVTGRPLERIFRDLMGGVVMAWKTDELQQTLGVGALGRPITFVGPAGT